MPDAVIFQKHESGVGMKSVLHPWQILLLVLAGWVNKHQQNAIEYLIAENEILVIGYQTQPLAIFSSSTGSSQRLSARGRRPGIPSFKGTGMFWQPLMSPLLRSEQGADWPHFTCFLSWNYLRGVCSSPAAL